MGKYQYMNIQNLSIITPSRNNLVYLKWNYTQLRKFYPELEWCIASDDSNDGTVQWLQEISKTDKFIKYHINDSGRRLGHTILYDLLINDYCTKDYFCIWHADMICVEDTFQNMLKHITDNKIVVSSTRIEPPLHPKDPAKFVLDFGTEPENFDYEKFNTFVNTQRLLDSNKITHGVFAPWICSRIEFQSIGGHDSRLFSPQSAEDSDVWNRLMLNGVKFIQSRDSFTGHLTCRGSRFNPLLTTPGVNSNEWEEQNIKSRRNFARKWHQHTLHDEYMNPIVIDVYDIVFVVHNSWDQIATISYSLYLVCS
jgi:glycosyltransferase involved in cell wall biosynthesis